MVDRVSLRVCAYACVYTKVCMRAGVMYLAYGGFEHGCYCGTANLCVCVCVVACVCACICGVAGVLKVWSLLLRCHSVCVHVCMCVCVMYLAY